MIAFQQPPYEQRHNQMESMFLSAIDMYGHKLCQDSLQKLILSETSIFDVLHSFFSHPNVQVRQAALEVYVRRSYIAYELNSVQHYSLSTNDCLVEFQLQLPSTHPNRIFHKNAQSLLRSPSAHDSMNLLNGSYLNMELGRLGIMAAFEDWEKACSCFDELLSHYSYSSSIISDNNNMYQRFSQPMTNAHSPSPPTTSPDKQTSPELLNGSADVQTPQNMSIIRNIPPVGMQRAQQYESIASNMSNTAAESSLSIRKQSAAPAKEGSPILSALANSETDNVNILNIFVKEFNDMPQCDDEALVALFYKFAQTKKELLRAKNIRRLTFSVVHKRQQPSYFTFRARDDFKEDTIYRHLEPALAFQLEIYRLRSFHLELIPTSNLKIHLYLGKAKSLKGLEVTDYRMFARCIIRHSDLITKEASYEYLQSEAERTLLEALNELEIASSHPLASKTDCNHIYMCFVPCVCIDPAKVEESVRSMVLRYGSRLWKLRVLQAELKMTLRFTPGGEKVPIRIFLTNESGYYLDISLYIEITDKQTGEIKFESYSNKHGPFHGRQLRTPYLTRDHLQLKRYTAQSNGTTYVYDFPEMFRQSLMKLWKQYYNRVSSCEKKVNAAAFKLNEASLDGVEGMRTPTVASGQKLNDNNKNELNNLMESKFFSCVELVIDQATGKLTEKNRIPGENDIGKNGICFFKQII